MPISWLWVSVNYYLLTHVLTRVLQCSPQPQEEDGAFHKALASWSCHRGRRHCLWTCKSIASSLLHTTNITDMNGKFVKCFNKQNKKPQAPATRAHKTPSSSKLGHWNIDDTDSSSDDDDCQQVTNTANSWLDEWKLYLNTHEVVLDDVGIVRWWGVCFSLLFSDCAGLTTTTLGVWRPLSNMAVTHLQLPCGYGLICLQWTGLLISWHHNL